MEIGETGHHGDVGFMKVKSLPEGLGVVKPLEDGRSILALGEKTGHHHTFRSKQVVVYAAPGSTVPTHFEVKKGAVAELEHLDADLNKADHNALQLEEGFYEIHREKSYNPAEQEIRMSMD